MSILIKGMEMPKNCYECLVRNQGFSGDGMKCGKTGSVLSWYDGNRKRMDDCPLVPVPPHGRLIDADAFEEENAYFWNRDFINPKYSDTLADLVNDAPTIIPAENKGYILTPQEEYDGLKRKYVVLKSDSGEPVEGCFVLRPDKDKAAIAALLAYADATNNHVLAKDIRAWISTILAEEGE